MKLQKLVYLAHGWWLAYHDDLVVTERPQVWRYGPVFPSMYRALSGFGERPIRFPQREIPFGSPPEIDDDDYDVTGLMDWVWSRYGGYTAIRLSEMTHQPGTPWRVMAERHRFQAPPNLEIPDDITKQYFLEVRRANKESMSLRGDVIRQG